MFCFIAELDIPESATQGHPVGTSPLFWIADVSNNPNAETIQLLLG
jgi:hypothetical protein